MPVFDDHRHLLVEWFERVDEGRAGLIMPAVSAACRRLRRVRNSERHALLAAFLEPALEAMQNGEPEGAKCILLAALTTFDWPSYAAE